MKKKNNKFMTRKQTYHYRRHYTNQQFTPIIFSNKLHSLQSDDFQNFFSSKLFFFRFSFFHKKSQTTRQSKLENFLTKLVICINIPHVGRNWLFSYFIFTQVEKNVLKISHGNFETNFLVFLVVVYFTKL